MAEKETKEERRARIQKEVAAESAARKEAYFEAQAKAKAGAEALAPELPKADAYVYNYAWRQDVGAPTGELKLVKTANPYYDASTNEIVDPATGQRTPATQSMWSGPTSFRADGAVVTGSDIKDPVTGLTPAQKEAADALAKAKAGAATLASQLGAKIDPNTGKIISSTIDPTKAATWYATQSNVNTSGKTEKSRVTNPDGSITITYTDGTTSVIPARVVSGNVTTGNTVGGPSTNVDVLKSMLRGLGFNSAIIDSSTSFLMALLKDGLDYDNAVAIFLNSKDYTLKDGKKIESPFYAEYSYLNEGLVRPKSASELYNAVEGYKEVAAKYNLNTKFTSKDYMKDYVKNNITVANLAERANLARLKSVNSDPAYIDSLRQLGYITSAADLTDFFLDPKIGEETLIQRRSVAAFGAEAIKRAKQGVQFATSRFDKIVSGLLGMGLSPEQVELRAAQGFENIGESLMPTIKLGGIYERTPASAIETIQSELETEEFGGLASERRKRLSELERRAFQAQSGAAGSRSFGTATAGLI